MPSLSTSRLLVRPFSPADLEDYLAYQSLPTVRQFMAGQAMSRERAAQFLAEQASVEQVLARNEAKGHYHALAVWHRAEGRVIGDIGFFLQAEPEDTADLGFQLHPAYGGQGYATEAVRALLGWGFGDFKLRRVTASCDARNTASWRLMERIGMRRQAHLRASHSTQGLARDEYVYALLREAWEPHTLAQQTL